MRIAHFSDTHLGFRAYSRLDPSGMNLREADVLRTFERALASIAERDPDVILHAGDFFDVVRPSNHTIVQAFRKLSDLQEARGGRPFVIVAGNHETPKTADAGCILRLFGDIQGVRVAINQPTRIELDRADVVAIPTRGLGTELEFEIRLSGGKNLRILVAHGIESSLGLAHSDFSLKDFSPDDWDYIALGDYHIRKEFARNATYSGSTDYTSSNIWEEREYPKGWYLFDTDSRKLEFVEVKPVRAVMDMETICAEGLTGKEIGDRLLENAAEIDDDLPIVRQRVVCTHISARSEIPSEIVRSIRLRCAHYRLDIQLAASSEAGGGGGGRSLEAEWQEFARQRTLPPGIEREELVQAGLALLAEVQDDPESLEAKELPPISRLGNRVCSRRYSDRRRKRKRKDNDHRSDRVVPIRRATQHKGNAETIRGGRKIADKRVVGVFDCRAGVARRAIIIHSEPHAYQHQLACSSFVARSNETNHRVARFELRAIS